jgi:exodeoxyribonuclease VII large subunit
MDQLALFSADSPVLTVSQVNRHLRLLLESEEPLQDLWVRGELSNLSRPASGHLYFSLKDSQSALRCVMWRADTQRLPSLPREGEALDAHGYISLYEAGGQLQLYVDTLRPAGESARYQEFLRLKAALEQEGLFAPERKRPLPSWPRRIGLVTSASGAALQDVLQVLERRYPLAEVVLAPSAVQGTEAPAEIARALQRLNRRSRPDVILVVRGGGSAEDLWAFNDEGVVRAIAGSAAPVVTGIGHETDFTLADFAADVRAPTPSAAAEIATPSQDALTEQIQLLRTRLISNLARRLRQGRTELSSLQISLRLTSPQARLANARQQLDDRTRRAHASLAHDLAMRRVAVLGWLQTLRAVGPQAVLARGYAIVSRAADGSIVRSVARVSVGEALDLRVSDGVIPAQVTPARGRK